MPRSPPGSTRQSPAPAILSRLLGHPTGFCALDVHSIIMDDNNVNQARTVSEQLKRRRADLGLSLSAVAKRAGTSPATLSRYENGWTRFETYTLRKLAVALGCELRIEFLPRATPGQAPLDRAGACGRLKRLFWDHPLEPKDLRKYPVWVVERVLDCGNLDDIRAISGLMGRQAFLQAVRKARRVSPRTRNFWSRILEMEKMPCTREYSRNTAWNS